MFARVTWAYEAENPHELSVIRGEYLEVKRAGLCLGIFGRGAILGFLSGVFILGKIFWNENDFLGKRVALIYKIYKFKNVALYLYTDNPLLDPLPVTRRRL